MTIELITPRLCLRRFVAGDSAAMAALFADGAVGPLDAKGAVNFAASFIAASADEWPDGGCGALAVVPRGDLRLSCQSVQPAR
ncbi:MAG: hypothetical protein QGG19_10150 [Alphaproteobacteria bacterium]|jgi:hypothetical protein|nr:hypothetical protein [Alphaproteobacteria bacterium]MDP6253438.1 hypothetical protein [Alphaproteobacteria bacterium]MDP7054735.1 hypothetical protein [Alphaproteobacteria bacterium]MDP7228226.1 hypothetical protein [Alphaproteobacteria bacterium]MDP7462667.1 hypothetical protein [Alphaproteobacteria bacterium]